MTDISDQLNGVIDDLAGLEDRLKLGGFIHIHQVLVQVKPCGGQQGTSIIMQVGGQALPFFFLQFNGSVQQDLLLFLFHMVDPVLESKHSSLVKNDENDQCNGKHDHPQGTQK